MLEADNNIGHLHTGVVDVVLHVHGMSRFTQQANERISQDCVAQMSYVRRLVGVNAGVLDKNFVFGNDHAVSMRKHLPDELTAIKPRIDVSRSGDFERLKTRNALKCAE